MEYAYTEVFDSEEYPKAIRLTLQAGLWLSDSTLISALCKPARRHSMCFWAAVEPCRRPRSVIVNGQLSVKGAPAAMLPRCWKSRDAAQRTVQALTAQALRSIAVTTKLLPRDVTTAVTGPLEQDRELLGPIGFMNPPRPEAAEAIACCRATGISLTMVTGDHRPSAVTLPRRSSFVGDRLLS